MWNMKRLRNLDKDDLLEGLGLQLRSSPADWILPTVGIFSVGILVGAGLGLILAPKSGREIRDDLRSRLQGKNDSGGALPTGSNAKSPATTS